VAVGVLACVGLELIVAASPAGVASRVTALLGLAAVAVALTLRQALSGVTLRGLRAAVLVPIVLSIAVTVVLMLDAHRRGVGLAP